MQTFKFTRTVQYTEVIEVVAETVDDAKRLANESEDDGECNNDETVISIELS
jgi:hypothetical protein